MVVNTKSDFGGAYNNREYGFHYFISPSDSYRASKTFAHEFGHGLLGLGDEYSNGYLLDDKELKSLNLSSVEDPEKIKWRQLLGFRNTYTCRNAYGSKMLVSSYECIMRDTNYQFCEVCRLQGFKRMSQLVKDVDLYVATPEVKEYTGAYSKPSDFTDLETSSYYNYTYNRNDRLLSGNSKSRFNTNMNGKKIELRTVIQNISDKNARQLKFKMWIKHSDGSVATDSSGNPLQTVQTFDIPVWNDKANFWPLGALDHIKSDFNSGLKSCSLIYQIPSDAQLKSGDTVAFQVLDENGNVLADDNTETQRYTTVSIQYKFEDGSEIPNTAGGTFTVPYGTKLDLTPAKTLYDYEFIKVDGLNKPIVSDGTVVTYYYKNKIEEKITLQYEAGDGGSIAAVDAATGKILENGAKIKPNAEVQFTASPNSGYSVKNWVVNGEVYKENGIVYTGMELKRAITASSDSVKVEFVKDEPAFVKGDVNLSGKVEIGDVREALRSICKKTELTALQKQAADVNENGNVDIEDLRKILRFVCGKIDQLNMEESGASK